MGLRQTALGLVFLFVLFPLQAAQPLVDANWLSVNLDKPNLVVLDIQPAAAYKRFHIPGAINSSYDDWRKTDPKGNPKMMLPVAVLEQLIGGLGIDNQTLVVLVVTGRSASEMASATRVYWTLKAQGHDEISILDGGLIAYANNRKNALERGINQPQKKTFTSRLRPDYLVTADNIKGALNKNISLIDSRSDAEFMGLLSGGKRERPGTLPGSVNLPFDWLTQNGGARFHTINNLKRIFQATGVPQEGKQISFCHTGHRTSLTWFVSHELLGNKEARMYDGSTAEWAIDRSLPMEQKIKLE